MVMFDHEGKIHKYETLNGIMQRFCKERIKIYEKRRQYMLQKLNKSLTISENKKRFMEDVMNHKIKILLQEDEVVHQQLLDMNYYKDDEGEFDYLLNMNIGGFRKKNVDKLTSKIDDLKKDIMWYTNTNEGQMWLKDILELEPFI